MANQKPSERKDRNGGGDVTKAEEFKIDGVDITNIDILNNTGSESADKAYG